MIATQSSKSFKVNGSSGGIRPRPLSASEVQCDGSQQCTYPQAERGLCEDTQTGCGGAGTDPSRDPIHRNPELDTYSPSSPLGKSLNGTEKNRGGVNRWLSHTFNMGTCIYHNMYQSEPQLQLHYGCKGNKGPIRGERFQAAAELMSTNLNSDKKTLKKLLIKNT